MVKTPLVEEYKTAGKDPDDWRLMLVVPMVDEVRASEVYKVLVPVIRQHGRLDCSDVTVIGVKDPLLGGIRPELRGSGAALQNMPYQRYVVNGADAYIYRMNL